MAGARPFELQGCLVSSQVDLAAAVRLQVVYPAGPGAAAKDEMECCHKLADMPSKYRHLMARVVR